MTKEEFKLALKRHDWYYMMSDSSRVYERGLKRESELNAIRNQLKCPFGMGELHKYVRNMVLEQFVEEEPGKFFQHPKVYQNIAPAQRSDLITQAEFDVIEEWFGTTTLSS